MPSSPPLRAVRVLARGSWNGAPTDRVRLDYDGRHRRRVAMRGDGGLRFLLDLPRAEALADGDGLQLEDGRIVEVVGADEELLEITSDDEFLLLRVAWHLGNRHLPTELRPGAMRIRDDHVIADMVRGLGADVQRMRATFQPEGGAYGHGRVHGHDHAHDDAHAHDHGHAHDHDHPHDQAHHHRGHGHHGEHD